MEDNFILNDRPILLYAGRQEPAENWRMGRHSHGYCEIVYITEGSGIFRIGGGRYPCRAGDLIIYNRKMPHEEFSDGSPAQLYYCAIENLAVRGLPSGCLIPEGKSPVYHAESEQLGNMIGSWMQMLHEECEEAAYGYEMMAYGTLLSLIVAGLRLSGFYQFGEKGGIRECGRPEDGIEYRIKAYIDENYTKSESVEEIAARLCISPYYMTHVFKKYTGQSPIDYLIRKRIRKSIEFLESGGYKVYEVAELVGYADPNYFSTAFKKVTGAPPSRYVRKN